MMCQSRNSFTKRKGSYSLKKQVSDSQNMQEMKQFHPRQFRLLTHCFYNNINQFYSKRHRDVLGDLEDAYKIPLAKQERIVIEESLELILERNIFKLARDVLMRNTSIARNINNYLEDYNKMSKSSSTQATNLLDIDSIETNQKEKVNQQSNKQLIKQRMHSSSKQIQKRSNLVVGGSPQHKNIRNGAISMGKQEHGCGSVNNQEAQCYVYIRQNCRRVSKSKLNLKYSKCKERVALFEQMSSGGIEGETYLTKNKSEVMEGVNENENEKYGQQLNCEKGERIKMLGRHEQSHFAFDLKLVNPKGNMNKFFNVQITNNFKQQSIDEMQKIKVQNKISSINSNFLTGITKSQGYRPKSKCWGNSVNSIGKASLKDRADFRSTLREGREVSCNNERQSRFLSTFLRYKS